MASRARRPGPVARWLLRSPAHLYDLGLGWVLGHRFLRLTHAGRRSGRCYRTVLEVVATGPRGEVVVIAGLGPRAQWYRNVQAGGAREVAIGRRRFAPEVRTLDEDEAVAALAGYERRNRMVAPVVRRVLGWLVGRPYDGSDAARRQLVRELPLVGLRPGGG